MKTRSFLLLVIIALMFVLMVIEVNAQVSQIYSKWASAQVMRSVEVDKPEIVHDTIKITRIPPVHMVFRSTFKYKDFSIEIIKDYWSEDRIKFACYSGPMRVMLKPDDEYTILEKLIPLTK